MSFLLARKWGNLYLRETLRLPAKGLCPSAHPILSPAFRQYFLASGCHRVMTTGT